MNGGLDIDKSVPANLSKELSEIINRKQFHENSEKYGLLPAVMSAQRSNVVKNDQELFRLVGSGSDAGGGKDLMELKMQLKVLKNLDLKEKLHYQRLITANTRNKNFNLTHQNAGAGTRFTSGNVSPDGTTVTGFGDYGDRQTI